MLKLLIADDERETREGIFNNIPWNRFGISAVELAEDGLSAIELSRSLKPDLLICDIRMPKMNGIEFVENLRQFLPACRVIFISGYSDKEYLKSAITLRAVDYIEKPLNIEELTKTIQDTVLQIHEEREKQIMENDIRNRLMQSRPVVLQSLALDIIQQHKDMPLISEKLRVEVPGFWEAQQFITLILTMDLRSLVSEELPDFTKRITDCIGGIIIKLGLHYLSCWKNENSMLIHISGNVLSREKTDEISQQLLSACLEASGMKVSAFVSIGKPFKNIEQLAESYRFAVMAAHMLFFSGFNNTAYYQELHGTGYAHAEEFNSRLFEALSTGSRTQAVAMIKQITHEIKRYPATLTNTIKNIYVNLLMKIIKAKQERLFLSAESTDESLWEPVYGMLTLNEIEKYTLTVLENYFTIIEQKDTCDRSVVNAIRFIKKNLHDSNLSIKTISDHVYLAPTYLCAVFKQETGKTINQFIVEERMQKARELLKDEHLKLSEISGLIGYSDPNYFAKVFKKYKGCTPSEYKERYLMS